MTTPRSPILYRHRLTRLGFHFLFVALFAIVGGSLRGFNLLLVLAGLLFSVVIVQWRQGRAMIHRAVARRRPIEGAFAGDPLSIVYEVANTGRFLPLWTLRLIDRAVPDGRVLESQFAESEWTDSTSDPPPTKANPLKLVSSLGFVPAGRVRTTSIVCRFNQRGSYQLGPLESSTTFPFSLMSCDALFAASVDTLWVYPRRLTLRRGWTDWLPPRRGGDGERSTGGANQDGEFFGLRPWQSGDQPKHIHWRTTARIGEPAVRQFEQRSRHQICLLVDPVIASDGPESIRGFEQTLRLAATLLCELAGKNASISIVAPGERSGDAPSATILSGTASRLSEPLKSLARARYVIDAANSVRPLSRTVLDLATRLERFDLVVVSSRSFDEAVALTNPADRDAHGKVDPARGVWSYFCRRDRLAWLNVQSAEVKRYIADAVDIDERGETPVARNGGVSQHALR